MKRPRSARLTFIQKQWIYMHHGDTDEPLNSISQRTGVSISTIRRIFMEFSTNVKRSEIYSKIRCKRLIESEQIAKLIFNYVKNQTGWFTAKNVQDHIKNELSVMIPLHQIRKHLKLKEGLSFQKGNSRPININIDQVKLLQKLFWVKIANILPGMKLLISIDESLILRYATTNYSWLKTGTSCTITNTCFIKSMNLITAITTTGLVINMLKSERTNAKIFHAFLSYVMVGRGRLCSWRLWNYTWQLLNSQIRVSNDTLKKNRDKTILPSSVLTGTSSCGGLLFIIQKEICTGMKGRIIESLDNTFNQDDHKMNTRNWRWIH